MTVLPRPVRVLTHPTPAAPALLTTTEARLLLATAAGILLWMLLYARIQLPFLLWNLFLAGVPIGLQWVWAQTRGRPFPGRTVAQAGLLLAWLLFLPNAPYIVTDFVHVYRWVAGGRVAGASLGALCIGGAALLGLIWWVRSVRYFEEVVLDVPVLEEYRGAVRVVLCVLCAYGVWLGRLLRFNTWDVVAAPGALVREGLAFAAEPLVLELTLVTALGLWGLCRVGRWWAPVGYCRLRCG